jgi:hypothetical protein
MNSEVMNNVLISVLGYFIFFFKFLIVMVFSVSLLFILGYMAGSFIEGHFIIIPEISTWGATAKDARILGVVLTLLSLFIYNSEEIV